jgi:glycosyltransferase involved in cell wall biosynthesis
MNDQSSIIGFDTYSPKRVTYILATKNRASQLSTTLDAIRQYITPMDELIVVDGLSNDGTRAVIERNSDIVNKFISEPDQNAAHAFNKGLMLAQGRYIKAGSDDDILHAEGMEQAVNVMDQHPEVDVLVCGGTKQILDDPIFEVWLPPGINYGKSTEDVFRYGGAGVGFVIRRNSLPLIGLVPSTLAADLAFLLEAIDRGAIVRFCRINLYHHPIHKDSYIIKYQNEFVNDLYRLLSRYCSRRFYAYYRIRRLVRRLPGGEKLDKRIRRGYTIPQRYWRKVMRMLRLRNRELPTTEAVKPDRWDGGFS